MIHMHVRTKRISIDIPIDAGLFNTIFVWNGIIRESVVIKTSSQTLWYDDQRVDMAFVTSLFRASSFFFRSSELLSSISSCAMASLRADSIFSFVPRLSLRDIVGSEVISSTREMYDSSCCRASNFLLKASSEFLNLAASAGMLANGFRIKRRVPTADHALYLSRRKLPNRIGNGDISTSSRCLLGGRDLEYTIDIDLEYNL